MKKNLLLVLYVLMLAGCTTWTQLEGREYQEKGRGFKAEMSKDWMRFNLGPNFMMTKNGTTLDIISVARLKYDAKLDHTKKKYFEGMTVQELAEIEIDNIRANGGIDEFETAFNRPEMIDGQQAYRVEYSYVHMPGGLKIRGVLLGFLKDKLIYRIRFEAADQYYFGKARPDFDRFINSFKLL